MDCLSTLSTDRQKLNNLQRPSLTRIARAMSISAGPAAGNPMRAELFCSQRTRSHRESGAALSKFGGPATFGALRNINALDISQQCTPPI
jgi:hypothetical protein